MNSMVVEVNTTKAAFLLNISTARLRLLLKQGRVRGARKVGRFWFIPLFGDRPEVSPGERGPQGSWCEETGGRTIISVNRHIIAYNKDHKTYLPPFRVKRGEKITYGHVVYIDKLMTLIYTPEQTNRNAGGATAWFECEPDVFVKPELFDHYDPNFLKNLRKGKYNSPPSKLR